MAGGLVLPTAGMSAHPPRITRPAGVTRAAAGSPAYGVLPAHIPIGTIVAVDFVSPEDGWVAVRLRTGTPALLWTGTGGKTWWVHDLPAGDNLLALAVEPKTGDQVGDVLVERRGPKSGAPRAMILSTSTGFKNWQVTYQGPEPKVWANPATRLRIGFQFVGRHVYAFLGDGILEASAMSLDPHWTGVPLPPGFRAAAMNFVGDGVGFVAGALGSSPAAAEAVVQTRDGGRRWTVILKEPLPRRLETPIQSVSFATPRDGWFYLKSSNGDGYLWHTTDGGRSWTREQTRLADGPTVPGPIRFVTPRVGWLPIAEGRGPTAGGLLMTRDGGRAWESAGLGVGPSVNAVSLVTATVGYAAGRNPLTGTAYLVKTVDGGRTWQRIFPATSSTG